MKTVALGSVARSVSQTHLKKEGELIFLNTSDIERGRILHRNFSSVASMPGQAKKSVELGDILFSEIRPANGRWALIKESAEDLIVSTKLMVIRPTTDALDPTYLYLFLTSGVTTKWLQILAESRSGTFPQITFDEVSRLELPLPPIEEQRAIAATLGTLDDKIESNRRSMAKAQELGDALFRSASVEYRAVSDVAVITMGSSPAGETLNEVGEGMPFYQGTRDFGDRFPSLRVWTESPVRLAKKNDTLMSVRAPVGELNRALFDCCVGRGVAAIHSESQPSSLYYAMRASAFTWDKFQGEGTVFASVNKKDVHTSEILWVSDDSAEALELTLSALDDRIESLHHEVQHLSKLRDSLLPALLSGQLRAATRRV